MGPVIIGLLGRAGSGKSTVAKFLEESYGAQRCSFAAPLKQMAVEIFDFSAGQVYGTQAQKEAVDPRYGVSPRVFMQRLGQSARTWLGADVWVKGCLDQIFHDYTRRMGNGETPPVYVIEDVRYHNEVLAIRAAGGKVWKLECPDTVTSADPTHPSEAQVDTVPHVELARVFRVPSSAGGSALLNAVVEALNEDVSRPENGALVMALSAAARRWAV